MSIKTKKFLSYYKPYKKLIFAGEESVNKILKEIGETLDYNEIHTPEELREVFLKLIDERGEDGISELMKNTLQEIRKYEVRPLVNEKMDNLYDLCQMKL